MLAEMLACFDYGLRFVRRSVADLSESEMCVQPPGVPNHAFWTLGHLITGCQGIATELGTDPWLPPDWEATFGYGSSPVADSARYPTKVEMLAQLDDSAQRLKDALLSAGEEALRRPVDDVTFHTWGSVLLQVLVGHTSYHAGQLSVWRRALGKQSAEVFV